MDDRAFWQQKLIQFFHDPPAKPFAGTKKAGRLKTVANALFDAFQASREGRKLRFWFKSAGGLGGRPVADRPMLYSQAHIN